MLSHKVPRLLLRRPIRPPSAAGRWSCKGLHTTQVGNQRFGNSIGRHLLASFRATASRSASSQGRRRLLYVLLPSSVAGSIGYVVWCSSYRDVEIDLEDIELPLMPEPRNWVHPYESWPWYQRAWFTFKRSAFLMAVFTPLMCISPLVLVFPENQRLRQIWLDTVHHCMQRAGAAFQKFGQWLSMRPDMFPPDVIQTLARLRCDAPAHTAAESRKVLREQLGHEVEEIFEEFSEDPIASGSVGQVHRAKLRPEFALDGRNGRLRDVAVKVQHPGVADSAFMDLDILWKVVDFSQSVIHMTMPFNRGEFDECIQGQMDFKREAFNLQKFRKNFRNERRIRFPKVSPKFVTSEVLIETWAEGKVISNILEDFDYAKYHAKDKCKEAITSIKEKKNEAMSSIKEIKNEIKEIKNEAISSVDKLISLADQEADEAIATIKVKKRELQGKLCSLLYDMSMKMMIRDNFVHGDLHGGNILYAEGDDHVTVLDAGIATKLENKTVVPFGSFLHALCSGNTSGIVKYLQIFNESTITVNLPDFTRDIQETMDKFMGPLRLNPEDPVNAADMFGEVMFTMQRYGMLLKGDVASTLFTISISEGLIRQLDPKFDVASGALPYIVRHMPSLFMKEE